MAGNSGGPWGGGGNKGGGGGDDKRPRDPRGQNGGGQRGPGRDNNPQIPEIDELVKKGQEQLRVLMGGGGRDQRSGGSGSGGGGGPAISRGMIGLGLIGAVVLWGMSSFYRVETQEQSIELFLGEFSEIGTEGLNFAPWPLVTAEVFDVTTNRTEELGIRGSGGGNEGLMLTTDENIVDIDFQVVWNIKDAKEFKFSLRDPDASVRAIAEAAMREVIAQSELAPILNRDRGPIADRLKDLIQATLNSYDAGVNIVRVNFDKADPPEQVIDSFREVQAAEQERDRLEKQADAYANTVVAQARGEAAQVLEEAEAYRAQVVNEAEGQASRFSAVLGEYQKAPEVTRKRLYLETMEEVLGRVDKIIIDEQGGQGGSGVVPYLPLNELRRQGGSN